MFVRISTGPPRGNDAVPGSCRPADAPSTPPKAFQAGKLPQRPWARFFFFFCLRVFPPPEPPLSPFYKVGCVFLGFLFVTLWKDFFLCFFLPFPLGRNSDDNSLGRLLPPISIICVFPPDNGCPLAVRLNLPLTLPPPLKRFPRRAAPF